MPSPMGSRAHVARRMLRVHRHQRWSTPTSALVNTDIGVGQHRHQRWSTPTSALVDTDICFSPAAHCLTLYPAAHCLTLWLRELPQR